MFQPDNNNIEMLEKNTLKGQSHEKFGEMRVWGLSVGHN
jgi:hypothetical protein